ncbi:MAG TPA: hypothetical protein VEU53_12375 [Stellaceae bacterium]|nr:hypothetical protein [Stellaceae bacterium]
MAARFVVHSLADACTALAAAASVGHEVTLTSAADAGGYAGPAWFKALTEEAMRAVPAARCDTVLDCGAAPGIALAALRLGLKHLRFTGNAEARRHLQSIAAQLNATIETEELPALDLRNVRHAEARCRAWLTGETMTRA